jgi:hypothetical protein
MADQTIPDDLRDFILQYIDSISQLEALLILRSDPGVAWRAPDLAKRIYVTPQRTAELLSRLYADGFVVVSDGAYRFSCQDDEVRDKVGRLAELYVGHLIPVTTLIHSKPSRIREFADAFKLRKDP